MYDMWPKEESELTQKYDMMPKRHTCLIVWEVTHVRYDAEELQKYDMMSKDESVRSHMYDMCSKEKSSVTHKYDMMPKDTHMIQHNHEWLSYDDDEEAERPNVMKSIA